MRILVKKVLSLFWMVPLGVTVGIGAFLGMFYSAFMWGFAELSQEILDKIGDWQSE